MPTEIRCNVGRALEGRVYVVTIAEPGDAPHDVSRHEGVYDGSNLVLTVPPDTTRGSLVFPGTSIEAVPLSWTIGADGTATCSVAAALPAPADASLFGLVRGAANLPEGAVYLEGCDASDAPVDADGSFFIVTTAGPCRMRAGRQDGALRLAGPWADVEALAGSDVEVELSVPTFIPAGMGIGFSVQADGVAVTQVHEGTPAHQAGLGIGDVITRVGGVPTAGMDTDTFLQYGIGPEGTEVRLEGTTPDGETFEVAFARQRIRRN